MRQNKAKESVFLLSVIAAVFPLAAVVLSLFVHTEPYRFFTIVVYLMEGSLLGSIFGVIALIGNRKKSLKVSVLSLIPMILLVLAVIADAIFFSDMP